MPLTIRASTVTGSAYMIDQQYTVCAIGAHRIGTAKLLNCMGVVLHASAASVGCVAHIEADVTVPIFERFIVHMIGRIRAHGGLPLGGVLYVGLFGNATGSRDAALAAGLRAALVRQGVPATNIADQRNRQSPSAPLHDAGSIARISGRFDTIIYCPATGVVDCYAYAPFPDTSPAAPTIIVDRLQGLPAVRPPAMRAP